MKKIVAILGFCLFFSQANAQLFSGESITNQANIDNKRLSWGYYLGFNTYDFNFDYKRFDSTKDLIIEQTIGFNVGLVGNLKLNNNFDLRIEPGVSFNNRLLRATYTEEIDQINATYIHLPILFKFNANRLYNFRPFVVGGVSASINLSSNENNPDAITRLQTNTFNYEMGIGIDLYLPYFKLSPSLRGVFGINDELVGGPSDLSNVAKMTTRGIFLNFTFQ
jgi:hypothetical protein